MTRGPGALRSRDHILTALRADGYGAVVPTHPRSAMMVRNLDRMAEEELVQVRRGAAAFRAQMEWEQ